MKEASTISITTWPIKAYDFFSVILPGGSLLFCCFYFEELYRGSAGRFYSSLPVHWIFQKTWHDAPNNIAQSVSLGVSLFVVYLSGQVVSSVANFFLDRILMYKCYGYPYQFLLLREQCKPDAVKKRSRQFYRGSIFWLHCATFALAIYCVTWWPIFAVIAVSLYGLWLVVVAWRVLCKIIEKSGRNGRLYTLLEEWRVKFLRNFAKPYNSVTNFIEKTNRTNSEFEKPFIDKYIELFRKDFGMEPKEVGSNNYWFALFYVRRQDPQLHDSIVRWYQTSIFARNMAISFYMAFLYSVGFLFFEHLPTFFSSDLSAPVQALDIKTVHIAITLYLLLNLAIFMTVRFHYFLICYYSKCLFRAYVFLHFMANASAKEPPKEDSDKPPADIDSESDD